MSARSTLHRIRDEAAGCERCHLFEHATQTVFGEGPARAKLMLVGEQPGDQEDLQGRPFVGPAGRVLDRALEAAGIERPKVWLTNAVKHFKFEPRGKRRIHQKPDAGEIEVCKFWLMKELELIAPPLVVALGATAGRALLGRTVTIGRERGRLQSWGEAGQRLLVTVHPSYLLRLPDERAKQVEYGRFVQDLRLAAEAASAADAQPKDEPGSRQMSLL
jgi:DNA polymerase